MTETRSAGVILDDAIASEGWSDATVIDVLVEYIEHVAGRAHFADFIKGKKLPRYTAHVWFERDRKHVMLMCDDDDEVFSLWDDEVDEAINDGFLVPPKHPRATESMWLPCLMDYARSQGFID